MRVRRTFARLSVLFLVGASLQVQAVTTVGSASAVPSGVAGRVLDTVNRPANDVRVGVSLVYPHRESLRGATKYLMADTTDSAGRYSFSTAR